MCIVLLCLVVCMTLLASFFLPSHLSLTCTWYICILYERGFLFDLLACVVSVCLCMCTCAHSCSVLLCMYALWTHVTAHVCIHTCMCTCSYVYVHVEHSMHACVASLTAFNLCPTACSLRPTACNQCDFLPSFSSGHVTASV